MKNKCKNKAKYIYTWAGKRSKACAAHTKMVCGIGKFMNHDPMPVLLNTNEQCSHFDDLDNEDIAEGFFDNCFDEVFENAK